MKISVSTYSFHKLINSGAMTQIDCIGKAKELGFDAVEIESIHAPEGITDETYAQMMHDEAQRQGITISNFTFGAELLKRDKDEEVARVKRMIDIAAILGAKSVRHDATTGYDKGERMFRGYEDALPKLSDACREITQYAKKLGIKTMVENHGYFSQDSSRVERLVNTVADENFGLLVDMGNFMCADEEPLSAVGRVAPYAFYVHAKDFHLKSSMGPDPGKGFFRTRAGNYLRGAIIGHGDVPVRACLTALKRADYDGYVAIEFEGMEDPIMALSIGIENLRRYINEA